MFLFAKEKKVSELIGAHLRKVEACLQKTSETVAAYLSDHLEEAKKTALEVDHLETQADEIRRNIIDLLYGGAFLPTLRQDVHALISQLDDVANAAESVCDFLLGERPEISRRWHEEIESVLEKTLRQFGYVHEAIEDLVAKSGSEVDRIRSHYRQVGMLESEIDEIEWRLTREIFRSDLDLAHKIHLRTWVRLATQLSDQIENLYDNLNVLVLKVKI